MKLWLRQRVYPPWQTLTPYSLQGEEVCNAG